MYFRITFLQDLKKRELTIEAKDETEAKNEIFATFTGITIIKTEKQNFPPLNLLFANFLTPKNADLLPTLREISVMLNAGITFSSALDETLANLPKTHLKKVQTFLQKVKTNIEKGKNLSTSFAKAGASGEVLCFLRLGEESGNFAKSFERLVVVLEENERIKSRFKSAMRYPAMLFSAIFVAFFVIMEFVVPKFRDIFVSFGSNLPLPTRILLKTQEFFSEFGLFVALFLVAFLLFLSLLARKNEKVRLFFDTIFAQIWLFKKLVIYSNLSRFLLVLSELVSSGVVITQALLISRQSVQNLWLQKRLLHIENAIENGENLKVAFEKSGVFEPVFLALLGAGGRSGAMDFVFCKTAELYKTKFDFFVDNIAALVEPLMLLLLGLFVVVLGLGIFMPMWDLSSVIR